MCLGHLTVGRVQEPMAEVVWHLKMIFPRIQFWSRADCHIAWQSACLTVYLLTTLPLTSYRPYSLFQTNDCHKTSPLNRTGLSFHHPVVINMKFGGSNLWQASLELQLTIIEEVGTLQSTLFSKNTNPVKLISQPWTQNLSTRNVLEKRKKKYPDQVSQFIIL